MKFSFWYLLTENRRTSIDIFLKASGYLDCAVKHVLPQLPAELRRNLPVDLAEGVLRAQSLQALGQGVDIQLGMATDSAKATLAVKRRLACEMLKCWQQVRINRDLYTHERIMETAPTLPEFSLALKPDEYQLPPVDSSWRTENIKVTQTHSNNLNGDR
ncbi:hypothetical protein P8452_55722 [Trifolium repens]|nr:Endosomal targeting BRO1 domain-containing protein [Trifolium repens]WJX71765.1 hypothetical protein P8452_55722 [Trifolium repens]